MQQAGDVKSASVIRYPDGRSKGWGLVEFMSQSGADEAISNFSDQELMGRKIFIREDREPIGDGLEDGVAGLSLGEPGGKGRGRARGRGRGRAAGRGLPIDAPEEEAIPGTALFVGNLPWSTTWQQLKEIFAEYNVKYADVKAGFDGRSRGYGIVRFDTVEEAESALALNGYALDGREILVRFDKQQRADE
jgi:RNA recognition motif-containing protein